MSKLDDLMVKYRESLSNAGVSSIDEDFLKATAKGLGPSIYLKDASMVSCSDETELDRVKNNYLVKKLGLSDGPKLNAAIEAVCNQMGSSNRSKYRVVFYYLLSENLGKRP